MFNVTNLYNQDTFGKQFLTDLRNARSNVLIESPFIRLARVNDLLPMIIRLRRRGVGIVVNTRNPNEHD